MAWLRTRATIAGAARPGSSAQRRPHKSKQFTDSRSTGSRSTTNTKSYPRREGLNFGLRWQSEAATPLWLEHNIQVNPLTSVSHAPKSKAPPPLRSVGAVQKACRHE